MRTLPFFEPKPPATQSSSASRSTRAWWVREVPGLAREVLDRDVLELRGLLDEELDDRVRVAGKLRRARDVLLDQAEARALLGDDEQAPEERAVVDGVRDPHVERLLEHDALRDVDEQAVLPERGVVRRELLVPADERVQPRMVSAQRLEGDALGRSGDLDPAFGDEREPGGVDVDQLGIRPRRARRCP